jgi:transposase-like protein
MTLGHRGSPSLSPLRHCPPNRVNSNVRGKVHTQTIESFWSLLRRGIMGSYHKISKAYLPLYLAEFTFRHNNRKNPDMFMELLPRC